MKHGKGRVTLHFNISVGRKVGLISKSIQQKEKKIHRRYPRFCMVSYVIQPLLWANVYLKQKMVLNVIVVQLSYLMLYGCGYLDPLKFIAEKVRFTRWSVATAIIIFSSQQNGLLAIKWIRWTQSWFDYRKETKSHVQIVIVLHKSQNYFGTTLDAHQRLALPQV